MTTTPTGSIVWALAYPILSTAVLWGLIASAGPAAGQDTWMLFKKEERPGHGSVSVPENPGLQKGDRPLEPKGGQYGRSNAYRDSPSGYGAPPVAPRSAAPVAVERRELAPLPEPPPAAPLAAPPAPDTAPPSAPRWETHTAPSTPPPPPARQTDLAPPTGYPARPSNLQRTPLPAPLARAAPRPMLDGLAALEPKALETIVESLELPSKSAAIGALWPEPWRAASAPVSPAFEAIRIEALRRAGTVDALKSILQRAAPLSEPAQTIILLRAQLLVGNREAGCALAGEAIRNRTSLTAQDRRDAVLAAGYCALAGGNTEAGKLTVDLIRAESIEAPFARAVLEGAGAGGKAPPPLPNSVGVLDYRIGEAAGVVWPSAVVERAEPAVLALLATAPSVDPGLKIAAAEHAVRLAILPPETLVAQYRGLPATPEDVANALASKQTGAMRRAVLMQAAEAAPLPDRKARLLAALLEDADKAGLRAPVARALGSLVAFMRPGPELAWFADSAAEILVQSGNGSAVDGWARLSRDHDHWRVLGALASESAVPDASALASLERIARAGRIDAQHLHRLVTVLDALDVQLPIPLWELASRTPQPIDGHLPATGVLAELKMASDKREGARTILRAAEAMGPARATEANLLTVGDVIRALKSAGFVREARAFGIEALIESWPRAAGH